MKQLLITIILTLSFLCQGQSNSYKDFDYNDILELKGLFYLKSDTTLVTGRIIRYNKKKEAKRYVFITNGKPNNLGWIQFNSKYEPPKESALGSVLTGAAVVTATVLAVSNNDPEVPIRNINNQNSVNGYFNEQKDNTSIAYREMSERNKISEELNNNKEKSRDHLDIISNIDLLETKGNYIDEKKYKSLLTANETSREKKQAILDVLEIYNTVTIENFQNLVAEIKSRNFQVAIDSWPVIGVIAVEDQKIVMDLFTKFTSPFARATNLVSLCLFPSVPSTKSG